MITIYKKKPSKNGMELIDLNDIFFNEYTAELLDDKAAALIEQIDGSKMLSKYTISSRFN